jgi:hypothetical protein
MTAPGPLPPNAELSDLRSRGVRFLSGVFWFFSACLLLIAANAFFSAVERWLRLLEAARRLAGLPAPASGVDWLLAGGLLAAAAVPLALIGFLYRQYKRSWSRRLSRVWNDPGELRKYARIRRLQPSCTERELGRRTEYLLALQNTPPWKDRAGPVSQPGGSLDDRKAWYRQSAAHFLSQIEPDVTARAVAAGLIVGIGRNRLLDLVTIASAALEMQLHVLARLGKKPSLKTWVELWKRTASSLFLNTYLNREDAWAMTLAVKKIGMGLQAAAEASEYAIESLDDVDWKDYLDDALPADNGAIGLLKGGLEALLTSCGLVLSVGASGVKQIGVRIDRYGEELLEGILAGGIIYYHGMAVAAECLSLDAAHRASPEMNRTIRQAVGNVCAAAGRLLRKQAQQFRAALKEKRKQAVQGAVKGAAHNLAATPKKLWDRMKTTRSRVTPAGAGPGEPGQEP